MDKCLKRLKQDLISMCEAGDGRQTQKNSMMGALHELKLLKVQTALEQLQISCKTSQLHQRSPHRPTDAVLTHHVDYKSRVSKQNSARLLEQPNIQTRESSLSDLDMEPSKFLNDSPFEKHSLVPHHVTRRQEPSETHYKGSLCNSASFSSSEDNSFSSCVSRDSIILCKTASHSTSRLDLEEHQPTSHSATIAELQGIIVTLSREGPSIDSDFSQFDTEDSDDWTFSLMSQSRNRQPLILGDNFFADLVGNWLDLPELESRISGEAESTGRIAEASQHPLRLSCSQEFCRRLSLTTSIFKKVLRSIRPDREKLHKEKPNLLHLNEETLFKRTKKNKGSKPKDSVYKHFWARAGGSRGKSKQNPDNTEIKISNGPIYDYSSAVWV